MTYTNRPTTQSIDGSYISGLKKHVTKSTIIPIDGATYTPAALSAIFQAEIDTGAAVTPAKGAWQKAVADAKAAKAAAAAVRPGFEQWVQANYGKDAQTLADFGVPPKKPRVIKPATKVASAVKAAATREARGTKGKVQKKAITGATAATPATPATKA
jgi:hypothetical protein